MKVGLYTLAKNDVEIFKGIVPDEVIENTGKTGYFVLGAVDEEYKVIGITQFYINMLTDEECDAQFVYLYVTDEYRNEGIASQMIEKVHRILRKSDISKSLVLLSKEENTEGNGLIVSEDKEEIFEKNGYIFMRVDPSSAQFLSMLYTDIDMDEMRQGVYWINR
ncbi:MAG: GNAT family N-acetyltransferase [Lachnospiraceae bacterium]|nr:GNAT family N-acetyltransferase [Lachnospiraceae bacterium]